MANDEDDPTIPELAAEIEANQRRALGYWAWRDKALGEGGAAREVLTSAGLRVEDLRSREPGDDPPDCEAVIDNIHCGVEVTELLDRRTLEKSLKGKGQHRVWTRESLLSALQGRIDRKDTLDKVKGGPYGRYYLVIVTDELLLDRANVESFLREASFRSSLITDAFLGLSYEPAQGGGSCPVFRLPLISR